jgi:drug/metabolite transporter (DMT)-like permease
MSNQRNGATNRLAAWATWFAVPGAVAQAGNNAAAAVLRQGLSATPGVSNVQALTAAMVVSFASATLVSLCLWWSFRGTTRAFSWRVTRPGALLWHEVRLLVGLSATALVFFSAMNALQTGVVPVGLVTVLISAAPIYLALLEIAQGSWDSLPVAVLGFLGMAVASWQSIVGVKAIAPAIPAALLAGLLLGVLQLVQKRLGDTYREPAPKVVGLFAVQALFLSVIFFGVSSVHTGVWPSLTVTTLQSGGALAGCYAASQLLLQMANAYGNPALVGVVTNLQLPAGFIIDLALFHRLPTLWQALGSVLILMAAAVAMTRRTRTGV